MPANPKTRKPAPAAKPKGKPAPAAAKTASYVIYDIDPALFARFKSRAATEGRQMKWLFHDYIQRYADGA